MFRRPHRRPFAAAIALSAAIGSVPVTLAIADEVPQGAANRSASLGDADAVASWVDETVLEGSAAAESTPTTPERRLLHRNSKRPSAKVTDPKPPASEAVLDTSLFEMAWPMLIVLFVISLCVYAFKRWMPRSSRPGGGDAVKILARHYLSSKQSLCLVRTGRRVVLVGITPDRISTLSEMTDVEEVASLVGSVERGSSGSFTKMFDKLTDGDLSDEAAEPQGDGRRPPRRDRGIREDLVVSGSNLIDTGRNVQDLIERVRSLSADAEATTDSR